MVFPLTYGPPSPYSWTEEMDLIAQLKPGPRPHRGSPMAHDSLPWQFALVMLEPQDYQAEERIDETRQTMNRSDCWNSRFLRPIYLGL
jgi:hypothetical protein